MCVLFLTDVTAMFVHLQVYNMRSKFCNLIIT